MIAPIIGQIVFITPFHKDMNMVMIEHGGGYHSLLTGLDNILLESGQWVNKGDVIGHVAEKAPYLKFEWCFYGQKIDPLPWLSTEKRMIE